VLAGINTFDQWGVELGKTLAVEVERALTKGGSGRRCRWSRRAGADRRAINRR
jgi:hypothetical protein